MRAALGAAGTDVRYRLHPNNCPHLEWQLLGGPGLLADAAPATSGVHARRNTDRGAHLDWHGMGRAGVHAWRAAHPDPAGLARHD